MLAAVPSILGGLASAGQAISSANQLSKDKQELARLTPAFYKIQDEYYDNYNQAGQLAGQGLTSQAKDYFTDMAGKGLGTAVSGVLQARGTPGDLTSIFDSYMSNARALSMEDANKQIENIKFFQQAGKDIAGQKITQWAVNEYAPYQNKLKELTQRISANRQNIWKGIQGIVGSAQAGVTATQNEKLINSLFKTGGSTAAAAGTSGIGEVVSSLLNLPFQSRTNSNSLDENNEINSDTFDDPYRDFILPENMK